MIHGSNGKQSGPPIQVISGEEDANTAIMDYYHSNKSNSANRKRSPPVINPTPETSQSQINGTNREHNCSQSSRPQTVYQRKGRISFNKSYEPIQAFSGGVFQKENRPK